jgi:hypothetical protein
MGDELHRRGIRPEDVAAPTPIQAIIFRVDQIGAALHKPALRDLRPFLFAAGHVETRFADLALVGLPCRINLRLRDVPAEQASYPHAGTSSLVSTAGRIKLRKAFTCTRTGACGSGPSFHAGRSPEAIRVRTVRSVTRSSAATSEIVISFPRAFPIISIEQHEKVGVAQRRGGPGTDLRGVT